MTDLDHSQEWLLALKWDADGMIPAIAQNESGRVVMFAWMNRESLQETLRCGNAVSGRVQESVSGAKVKSPAIFRRSRPSAPTAMGMCCC
jgi:hypothetical protein